MVQLTSDDIARLRAMFPALKKEVNGQPAVFFDGPPALKFRNP